MQELISKLAAVAGELRTLTADGRNQQQGGYLYVSADQVLRETGAALSKHGVAILPAISETAVDAVPHKDGQRYDATIALEMTVTDGVDTIVQQWVGRGADYVSPDKALLKGITAGHKSFLMKLFCIGADDQEPPRVTQARRPKPKPHKVADLRATIEGAADNVPLGFVADRLYLAGVGYEAKPHAFNALRKAAGDEGERWQFDTTVTRDRALKMFDWGIDYKVGAA